MGPISLFDKSFIQSLGIDESVWFDNFYLANISPVFYAETLADLQLSNKSREEAEARVRIISSKTPELGSVPNVHHSTLALNNLYGYNIDMEDFRPILAKGIPTNSEGKKVIGLKYLKKQKHLIGGKMRTFFELERDYAKKWREDIKNLSFEFEKSYVKNLEIDIDTCKNTDCVYTLAQNLVSLKNEPQLFAFFLTILNISRDNQTRIIENIWKMDFLHY
ncbi:MAG: hypothetical protein Q9M43_15880 [Sulfurimonas sp.]|nr:hypothetical protein [Sulfurimonas sp.]